MKNSKPGRKTKTKKPAKQAKSTGKPGVRKPAEVDVAGSENAMSEALAAKCEAMRELEQKSNRQEIEVRYTMAEHCRDVVDGDGEGKSYGARAVEMFADEIKWAKSQVYVYAKVATVWTVEEVLGLEAEDHCTWAHLLSLASDKLEKHRDKLIERVKADNLSVRDLKREIKNQIPPEPPKQVDHTADTSPSVALVEALQDYGAKLTVFEADGKADAQRLQHAVQTAEGGDLTPAAMQQLRQVRKRLKAVCERDSKVFDECIAQAEKAKKSKPKPAKGKPKASSPAKKAKAPTKPARKAAAKRGRPRRPERKGSRQRIGRHSGKLIAGLPGSRTAISSAAMHAALSGPALGTPRAGPLSTFTRKTSKEDRL